MKHVILSLTEDFVSALKLQADKESLDVTYILTRLPSPDNIPQFECKCIYKHFYVLTVGHGKKKPKQHAAQKMLLLLSGDVETNPGPTYDYVGTVCSYFKDVYFKEFDRDGFWYVECLCSCFCCDGSYYYTYSGCHRSLQKAKQKAAKRAFINQDIDESFLLLLSGDVESNPGPIQSRPLQYRYNDPRVVKLEKALTRRDDKVKTLIRELRRQIKANIYSQGLFEKLGDRLKDSIQDGIGAEEMNRNLSRLADFLENTLPGLQANIQATILDTTDKYVSLKEDIMKVLLVVLLVRLLMVWKKYRAALCVILVFVFKFYGFDQQLIDMIMSLKAKIFTHSAFEDTVEDVVYHPWFHTCGKIIFAVMAFLTIKKIPGKQDWDTYIARLDRIPKSIEGGKKIIDYCSEYFNLANDQIKMMVLGKSKEELQRANGLYGEIHAWAQEVRQYLELDQRDKIDLDTDTANKVEQLWIRGLKFKSEPLLSREMSQLVSTTLLPAKQLYEYVSCSPVKGGGPRMRPICLWLVGESGVGKTEMVYPLCIDVLREMGLMKKDDFHHQVYGRQVETEFWDGYKGQKIVIYDDAFQKKDDKTAANPEIFEVIRSCNTFPQHLHMAALHDKNTFSAAEVLLYTTNDHNVKLESITFPDAFFNRMGDMAYKVMPKKEYALRTEKQNSGNTYLKLDKTKLNPDVAIDLSIYEFQKIIRDDRCDAGWVDSGVPLTYEEFSKMVCSTWRSEKDKSLNKLKWLENYAIRAQVESEYGDCEYDDTWFVNDISRRILVETIEDIESDYATDDVLFGAYHVFKTRRAPLSKWQKYKDRMDIQLGKIKIYLATKYDEIKKVLSDHPILSAIGIVGVALSALVVYNWFTSSFDKPLEEVAVSGDARTVRLPRKLVEVGVSGDIKTQKQVKPVVESDHTTSCDENVRTEVGFSGDVKTNRSPLKRVEVEFEELQEIAQTQGCSDEAAQQLVVDVFQKNTYRMSYFRGDKRFQLGNCTFVRGWSFIMPYHFIQALFARKLPPNTIISFSQQMSEDLMQVPLSHFFSANVDDFSLTDNCVRIPFKNGEYRDCVMVNLHSRMCTPHRDLVRHFVLASDQGKLKGSFSGAMATFHVNNTGLYRVYNWLNAVRPCDKKIEIFHPEDGFDYPEESYTQRDCYEYNAPTRTGDCGSLVGLYNKYLERKIIGMHIAGNDAEEHGYACPLTQDCLELAFAALVDKNKKNISSQFYYEMPTMVDPLSEISVPEGKFCALGKSSIRVGQATNSSIIRSRIYGKLSVPTMKPALLRPAIINGKMHNPLLFGLKKCGVDTAVLNDDEVLSASQDVCRVMLNQYNGNLDKSKYQRILTYEEAVRGTQDDEFMCAINRTTSPGFPYAQMKKNAPGKQQWMGVGEDFDFTSAFALSLKKDVEQLLEDCASGKITNVIFIDTLKDERREIAKVDSGKTRVFSAGPQHFVIAFRQYFLPFAAWLMHNRIDNEIAVGTNVYSTDWERIAKRLKMKGGHVIAGDFGNFDGSLVAQILWAIFWEIFVVWLKQFTDIETVEGERTLRTCLGLWSHLVHSVHIYDDNVYMWTHSQPSGNPFTVIINCLYNSIIMRLSWIRVMERYQPKLRSMKWFKEYVSLITYGDDNVLNIDAKVIKWFNQVNISEVMTEMRHEYTDEAKTGEIVKTRKLEDIYFLKRKFRFSSELQRHVAPLKLDVIYEMLNWSRRAVDPDEILMSNIETAFREVVYHGKEEYDKLRSAVLALKVPQELPENPQILTYDQYLHDIEYLADPLYDF